MATTLLLLGALFGVAPATVAHAAPSGGSVSNVAFERSEGSGSHSGFSSGGVSKVNLARGSKSSKTSKSRRIGTNSGSHGNTSLLEAILGLIFLAVCAVYAVCRGFKKVRTYFGKGA
ncbi:hypothetical protein ACGFWI_03395 [Streptomyces sp. NPDC048434]|uniref:hypothetical protein n=1 Tax=Streptomyces sp. NPDC048434 TaxID=3365549 RepID=UPI0037193FC8